MTVIPLVSVVLSVYNIENYIEECLNSIIEQTYTNLEILCVNDGSTDNSLQLLNEFSKKDDRIKIIDQANQGLSSTRNAGISNATGKYIYFIDGDDFISENYIQAMVNCLEKGNAKAVHNPNYTIYYEKDHSKNEVVNVYFKDSFETNRITHSTWSKLFDLSFLKETKLNFYEGLKHQDYEFWNKFIAHLDTLSFCHEEMYFYRQRLDSITYNSKTQKAYKNHILVCIDSIYSYYSENKGTLNFKPLYIALLDDHLNYQNKRFRLKFIMQTRSILKKFDSYYKTNIIKAQIDVYNRFTAPRKVLKLIYKSYCS